MKIDLTKKQYECLIKSLEAASSVYGILGDDVSEEYKPQSIEIDELIKHILNFAKDFKMEHLTEKFMGELILNEEYAETLDEIIEEYDNNVFWHELETRLGKRDYERTETPEEKEEMIKNKGWYPERIHELYESWAKELEDNGLENLGIVTK